MVLSLNKDRNESKKTGNTTSLLLFLTPENDDFGMYLIIYSFKNCKKMKTSQSFGMHFTIKKKGEGWRNQRLHIRYRQQKAGSVRFETLCKG